MNSKPNAPWLQIPILGAVFLAGCRSQAAYVGVVTTQPKLDAVETTLAGPVAGMVWTRSDGLSTYAEGQWLQSREEELEFRSFHTGVRSPPSRWGQLEVRARLDLGRTWARFDPFENSNGLFSIGVGIQPTLYLSDDLAFVGLIGYRFYFDRTARTRCNDGHESSSSDPDVCFDHGGLASQRDLLGDGRGPEMSVGIRLLF